MIRYDDGSILLHQQAYVNRILKIFNMADCSKVNAPMADTKNRLESVENPTPTTMPYRELIGSLLYCAIATRPDILFAVNRLAKYNSAPMDHWSAAKRVLRYLQGTATLGLYYPSDNDFSLLSGATLEASRTV